MTECQECHFPYPSDLIRPLQIGEIGTGSAKLPFVRHVCAICAYELIGTIHGMGKDYKPDPTASPRAYELLQRCQQYRKEHP